MRKALRDFAEGLYTELFLARDGPSFSQVRRRISDGRHAIIPALQAISTLSAAIDRSQETMRQITIRTEHGNQAIPVANWPLAFIAKELVYAVREDFDQPLTDGLIASYSNWYTSIIDPRSFLALFSASRRRQRAQSILIRMDYEQIALQRLSPVAEIARALILYESPTGPAGKSACDPSIDFIAFTGLSIMDFMVIGFACFARGMPPHRAPFTAQSLTSAGVSDGPLAPHNVDKFLAIAATDYDLFRKSVDAEERSLIGYEKYALNPLFKTPIIRTHVRTPEGDPLLVAPIPSMLTYRVTHGLYWDLLDNWSRAVASHGRSAVPDFPAFFGQAFQRYVGALLSELVPAGTLFPERRYGPSARARDSCDWTVLEKDTAILIECKTSRFHKATKATGDPSEFLKEATDTYAKAIVQLLQTKQAIQRRQISLPSPPTRFLGLVVIFDHLLMATIHLKDDLRAVVPRIDSTFTPQDVDELDYRILPIRLLEVFTPTIVAEGLARVFDPASWEANRQREQGGHSLPNLLKAKFAEFEARSREAFRA